MISNKPPEIALENQQDTLINIPINNQSASSPSFTQRMVEVIKCSPPSVLYVLSVAIGATCGYTTSVQVSGNVISSQGYGSYKCFPQNEAALNEAADTMRILCITVGVVASVISPKLYSIYHNSTKNSNDS